MLRTDASAGAEQEKLPPEEAKLYAQRVSWKFHPWAELEDVCAIVDAKAKLPGLLQHPWRLRQEVSAELDRRKGELQETIKRRRIQRQRALEQLVREKAAERRAATVKTQRAAAQDHAPIYGRQMTRKRERDEAERALCDTEKKLRTLRERGAPQKPAGPEPTRLSKRGPWSDQMRAHEKHMQRVTKLQQERERLQQHLNKIGMSPAMLRQQVDAHLPPPPNAHAIVPSIGRMTGASKPYKAGASYADTVYDSGREEAAKEPERLRLRARDECEPGGQFPALAPYCGMPAVDPLAYYASPPDVGSDGWRKAESLVKDMTAHNKQQKTSRASQSQGRTQPQTATTERNEMIAKTDADGEDYLLWGRTQRLRLEKQRQFEQQRRAVHAEKQQRWRGQRQVDLENAAERLQKSQWNGSGSVPWRISRALQIKGPQLIVATASQAAPVAAALAKRYAVLIWVPDDDPRPGRLHNSSNGWNLERDVLDWLSPQRNGNARSEKTEGCRHRATLKRLMAKELQSWPVAVIIAASTPVSKPHYRTAMALQQDCGLSVIVCDPAAAQVQAAGGLEAYAKSQGAKERKSADEKAAGRAMKKRK